MASTLISGETSAKQTLKAAVLLVLVAFAAWFVFRVARIFLLIFAGTLIAVFLHGCASWLARRVSIPYAAGVVLTILVLLAAGALCGWIVAPRVEVQIAQFQAGLPQEIEAFRNLGSNVPGWDSVRTALENFVQDVRPVKRISDWVIDFIVVAFLSVYLALQPKPYIDGMVALILPRNRDKMRETLHGLGAILWRWFIGRIVGMTVIGLLVFIALWSIGFPLAFTLGLLAGVMEFIPYVGATLSSIPALLMALSRGTNDVWLVLGLYLLVHGIDGYIVIPLVERRAVRIPPAFTIVMQLAMYWTAGVLGMLIADPLAASALYLLKHFYIEPHEHS